MKKEIKEFVLPLVTRMNAMTFWAKSERAAIKTAIRAAKKDGVKLRVRTLHCLVRDTIRVHVVKNGECRIVPVNLTELQKGHAARNWQMRTRVAAEGFGYKCEDSREDLRPEALCAATQLTSIPTDAKKPSATNRKAKARARK